MMLPVVTYAQTEEFSVATLNVDGLPNEIMSISINPDGPGVKYTPEIADYLFAKDYDFVGFQENFNYYDMLYPKLDANYEHDESLGKIDLEHFVRIPYPNDGINLIWRKGISGSRTDSVCWNQSYGLINHASDELTNKGYRRYELTLRGGSQVVVYNGHWDASNDADEESGEDKPDRLVRMDQWRQIRDNILSYLDTRPVIVLGDVNSYYCRDSVKQQFIDYIEATGKAHVYDAWIEMEKQGKYPEMVEGPVTHDKGGKGWVRQGELLDKILFINPMEGSQLTVKSYSVDSISYIRSDDKTALLGDHIPVAARFSIAPGDTGIEGVQREAQLSDCYYDLNGRRLNGLPARKGIYIYRGKKIVVK